MATIRRHAFINRSADDVWVLVGRPELLHEWFPTTSTKMEGNKRWIYLASGIVFEEDIITLDHALRRFQYTIVNNRMITSHLGTVDVIDDPHGGCVVVYSTEMEPEVLGLIVGGAAGAGLQKLKEIMES